MPNKKCHNCGVVDSVHRKDEGHSKLLWAFGPYDDDGLQTHLIYCRSCGFVNIYKPGWFGNTKYDSLIDVREVYKLYKNGQIKLEEMGMFAGKLQQAMIEDGVLPNDWEIV
jgi:hypothetical protein